MVISREFISARLRNLNGYEDNGTYVSWARAKRDTYQHVHAHAHAHVHAHVHVHVHVREISPALSFHLARYACCVVCLWAPARVTRKQAPRSITHSRVSAGTREGSLSPHFFLPPEIFALIASASAFCFFICSFWAKDPSSSSSSSSFLPLAAAGSTLGQQMVRERWCSVR